jgi:cardiolipin synthase (CMP-forming)
MSLLQYLPNSLTISRLLLALPMGVLILREEFHLALAVGLLAGITDALDGFAARRLQSFSRFGAALDPIADKVLITVIFLCFAQLELIPWYLALTVIIRDLAIVTGATCYHFLIGPFDFAATRLSKANMFVQICFCLLLLLAQVLPAVPAEAIIAGTAAVMFIAVSSGMDYVLTWAIKAFQAGRERDN